MALEARFFLQYAAGAGDSFTLNVDLRLPGRGVSAIFGPSGCGKTTLLRCIAGLQQVQQGRLHINGEIWQDGRTCLPAHRRPLGYVFQEASLFSHLTARGNLDYALKRATATLPVISCDEAVELLGIGGLLARFPAQLSGGERQRVAIARALLINPRLLLMDEPLASLDLARKREILPYLERLRAELDIPIVYVSHAMDEVARLADQLVVMERGSVATGGPLAEVLAGLDCGAALGEDAGVVLEARVVETDSRWHLTRMAFAGGDLWLRDDGAAAPGETLRARVLARDVSLTLEPHRDSSIVNILPGEITDIAPGSDPASALVRLKVGEVALLSRITRRSLQHLQLAPGRRVWAQIKSVAIVR